MGKIITVSAQKGGCLKTSITTNLAAKYSLHNKKVLIVDMDSQGNVGLSFGLNPDEYEQTIYDVAMNTGSSGEVNIYDSIINVYQNIDVCISNDDMNFFEFDLLMNKENYDNLFMLLFDALHEIKNDYDYIFVDTPPTLSLIQGNALACSDEVIIPFQPEPYSMRSLQKMIDAIEKIKHDHNPKLKISGVVGTLVDMRTNIHRDILKKCKDYCEEQNINFFNSYIPKSIRFVNSMAENGLPAVLVHGNENNHIIDAYTNLHMELETEKIKEVTKNG